jgi:hypothetical protein
MRFGKAEGAMKSLKPRSMRLPFVFAIDVARLQ